MTTKEYVPYILCGTSLLLAMFALVANFSEAASDMIAIKDLATVIFCNLVLGCILFIFNGGSKWNLFMIADLTFRVFVSLGVCIVYRERTSFYQFGNLYTTISIVFGPLNLVVFLVQLAILDMQSSSRTTLFSTPSSSTSTTTTNPKRKQLY